MKLRLAILLLLAIGCDNSPKAAPRAADMPAAVAPARSAPPSAAPSAPSSAPAAPSSKPASAALEGLSNQETYFVRVEATPSVIPQNDLFSLKVWVADAATPTAPARDVTVVVDAGMPEHQHGMNTAPQLTATAEGWYDVEGMMFHMPGFWEIYVDVTRGGVTERAQFRVDLE